MLRGVLVPVPFWVAVAVDAAAWVLLSAWAGWRAARRPLDRLDGGGAVHLPRYERTLAIRAWKDRLPEAGGWFGGLSKRHLPPADDRRGRLQRFARESRRAELTHLWILAATPLFVVWNPWPLFLAMVAFALVANVPCLLVARYNRGRVTRALSR